MSDRFAGWGTTRPPYQANYARLAEGDSEKLLSGVLIALQLNTGVWITAATVDDQLPDLLLEKSQVRDVESSPLWVTVSGLREQIKLLAESW